MLPASPKRVLPGYDVLSFVEKTGPRKLEFLDFSINRRPLSDIVEATRGWIGVFGWQAQKIELASACQLLRREPSPLTSGRVPLYICAECGDLGCGCIAVSVHELEECVVWSELSRDGYGTRKTGFELDDAPDAPVSSFPEVRDYYFLRSEYEAALFRFSAGYKMRPTGPGFRR
jgi:hypothetical protein